MYGITVVEVDATGGLLKVGAVIYRWLKDVVRLLYLGLSIMVCGLGVCLGGN